LTPKIVSQGFEVVDILTLLEDITASERRELGENGERSIKGITMFNLDLYEYDWVV